MTIVFGLGLVVALVSTAFGRWWYIPLALMMTAGLAMQWATPRRLHRRRELLAVDQPPRSV